VKRDASGVTAIENPKSKIQNRIMPQRRIAGIALAFVSGVLFATLPIFFRGASTAGFNLVTALALRFTMASFMIWLVVWRGGTFRLTRAQVAGFMLMGLLYIGQSSAYLSSAARIPIATTSILLYTYPAIVTVLARIFLHERFTRIKMISLGLALAGTLLTLGAPQAANDWLGIAFGLAGSFIYSAYIIIGAKVQGNAPPAVQSAVITLTAGVALLIFGAASGQLRFNVTPDGWLAVLAVAALSTALPILFFLMAVSRIGASQTSIISTSELVSTAIFGLVFLSQPLTALQVAGGIMIFAAVLLLARSSG
jgi:drug/metabolite transporter (DMT)-like permease